jgi:hypothetical protein
MSRPAIPPADRLILSLVKYGGSAPLTKIRANFYGRLTRVMLNKVLLELDDLIEVERTRAPGSKRPTTSIVLTWRGEVAARVLKPGFRRKRITLTELKAELAARQAEQNPWACQIQKDAEHRRKFDRQEAAGWTWRPPKPVKAPADPPREIAETGSGNPSMSPRPIAAPELRQQLTPAQPADDFTRDYLNMQRDLATIHEPPRGFSNLPKPADVAENARIIALFHKTPHSGELLSNGKIRYDNRDFTPQQWEKERFKQAN